MECIFYRAFEGEYTAPPDIFLTQAGKLLNGSYGISARKSAGSRLREAILKGVI